MLGLEAQSGPVDRLVASDLGVTVFRETFVASLVSVTVTLGTTPFASVMTPRMPPVNV
ncbi:MAG: hypothetical protein LC804_16920 [Acidobacteria bacterium]|nr:hypothetical protein [Acidobacteriota bacterium]